MLITVIFFVITGLYIILMGVLIYGNSRVKSFNPSAVEVCNRFSICIPFRDEENQLSKLFASLKLLDYPKNQFEILLINDNSEDKSKKKCHTFIAENPTLNIRLLQNVKNPVSPKKEALEKAIVIARNNFIVTTDADCAVPKNWLRQFDAFIQQNNVDFIAGPVVFKTENNFLNRFQELDFLGLQSSTIGGFGIKKPFLCNGANLCYSKKAFQDVDGFSNNKSTASGDDIFLLEKIEKQGLKSGYLKNLEACVETIPPKTFSALVQQRVRWAAKTSHYKSPFGKLMGGLVFLMNAGWILILCAALFQVVPWPIWIIGFILKFNVDFILIYRAAQFFKKDDPMKSYVSTAFLHPFFIVFVGLKALVSNYHWKGREFKR